MRLRGKAAPPALSHGGAWIPSIAVHAALAITGALLTYVDYGLTGWLVAGVVLSVVVAWVPQHLFGWVLILFLAAGRLAHHPGVSWQFLVLLAGLHLLHVLSMLSLELPWRSRVQPMVFVAPLRRFIAIQVPTQLLAVLALVVLAPRPDGHRPLTVAGFSAVGALAMAGLALLVTRPHHGERP
jgi:hypothetical protein